MTVLEGIGMSSEPGASPDGRTMVLGVGFELVTSWVSDEEEPPSVYAVRILGPTGRTLADNPIEMPAFTVPALRGRSRVRFPGLVYDGVGVYLFKVIRRLDGAEVIDAEVPLSVAVEAQPLVVAAVR